MNLNYNPWKIKFSSSSSFSLPLSLSLVSACLSFCLSVSRCMLMMYNSDVCMCASGAVNTDAMFCVEILMYKFSLAYSCLL